MNIRALRLPILFSGFVLSILVSLNAFSLRSSAQVCEQLPFVYSHYSWGDDLSIVVSLSNDSDFLFAFTYGTSNNNYEPILVFNSAPSGTVTFKVPNGIYNYPIGISYSYNGVYYFELSAARLNLDSSLVYQQYVYYSIQSGIDDGLNQIVPTPSYADFGFNNISYATYVEPNATLLFDQYDFENLSYYFQWSGSTDPDYPITSYNYALYGYSDISMDNTNTANGTLVSSGTDSVSNHFNYYPPYGSIANSISGLLYDKVVLYLTPFSGTTEGNTFYVVLNVVRGVGWSVDLGPFELSLGDTIRDYSIGDGIIQVPTTDVIEVEDGKYIPVGYIDNVPIAYSVQNTYGIYNTSSEYHVEYNNYSPVIYGDSEYITNNYDDHSTVINNNQTYNNIVNNISPDLTINSDSDSYGNKVISFLTSIVMFLQTCWVYFVQSLLFFPDWVTVLITSIVGLLGTVIIALGVIKLL